MEPTIVERLSKVEFRQLSADERTEHIQHTLEALRASIPNSGAAAGAFIDRRLYLQELFEWAPTEVAWLWPLHRAGIERSADEIHAAFQEALDNGALSPVQAQYAASSLQVAPQLIGPADDYI
jgi:hypothetical protein